MAWFLRKSFRLGPLRLNLSKSGLGVSADVGTVRPMIAAIYARKSTAQGREADGHPLMAIRHTTTTATVLLWLASAFPASAEMTVQGWLDFYNGKSSTVPPEIARVLAATYTLGMADGLISTELMSCPKGYIAQGEVIARRAADVLRAPNPHPGTSVTVAVLAALTLDGCTAGPRAKEGQGQR